MDGAGQQQVPAAFGDSGSLPNASSNASPAGQKKARVRKGKTKSDGGAADDNSKRRCVSTACIGEEISFCVIRYKAD